MVSRNSAQLLTLELGQLGLQFEQPSHGVVPTLLERAGDQTVAGVDRFIAPFRQVGVVASPLNPPMPLCSNCFVAFFQAGQRFESEFDGQRCDGGQQTLRDNIVERLGRHSQAGVSRQGFPVFPDALIDRITSSDERTLDSTLRQINEFGYDVDRLEFVAKDEVELLEEFRQDYNRFIDVVTQVVKLEHFPLMLIHNLRVARN